MRLGGLLIALDIRIELTIDKGDVLAGDQYLDFAGQGDGRVFQSHKDRPAHPGLRISGRHGDNELAGLRLNLRRDFERFAKTGLEMLRLGVIGRSQLRGQSGGAKEGRKDRSEIMLYSGKLTLVGTQS